MKEVYIADGLRTAVGSFGGALASVSAVELGRTVVRALLDRAAIEPGDIDEVTLGCVLQSGLGQNVARQVLVKSGIPVGKTAQTVNMVCGSGLRAIAAAAQAIKADDAAMVIAGGVESMSQAPYILRQARAGYRMGDGSLVDSMISEGSGTFSTIIIWASQRRTLPQSTGSAGPSRMPSRPFPRARPSAPRPKGDSTTKLSPFRYPRERAKP